MDSRHDRTASRLLKAGIGATVAAGAFKMMGEKEKRGKQQQLECSQETVPSKLKGPGEGQDERRHRLGGDKSGHRVHRRHSLDSDRHPRGLLGTERDEDQDRHHKGHQRSRAVNDDSKKPREDRPHHRGRHHDNTENTEKPQIFRGQSHSEHSHLRVGYPPALPAPVHRLAPWDGRVSSTTVSLEPSVGRHERLPRAQLTAKAPNSSATVSREPSKSRHEQPPRPQLTAGKPPNDAEIGEGNRVHFANAARVGGKAYH